MKKLTKAFPHREGAGRADEVESGSFRQPSYNTCHCEPVRRLVWQSVLPRFPSFSLVLPRSPLAPPLGELAAKPTERVKIALSAPLGHLSHRERQVALIRLALAGDARATFPQGKAEVTHCPPGLPAYVHRSDSMGMTCFFRLMIRGRKAVFSFGVTLKA